MHSLKLTLASLLLLGLTSLFAQGQNVSQWIGSEIDEATLTEWLGPDYETSKYPVSYRPKDDWGLKVVVDEYGGKRTIKEIYISDNYFDKAPLNGEVFPGIKAGLKYEKCQELLAATPGITDVDPGSDLNGKYIECIYTSTETNRKYLFHFRFRPKKKHYILVAFKVEKKGYW